MIYVCTVFSLYLTLLSYKRNGVFSATFIHCFYCIGCMITMLIVFHFGIKKNDVLFSAMPLSDFSSVILPTFIIYTLLIATALAINISSYRNKNIPTNKLYESLPHLKLLLNSRKISQLILFISCTFIFCHSIHFISINHNVLMSNTNYLSIKDPNLIGLTNPLGRIYHFLFRYIGLVFAGLSCLYFLSSKKFMGYLTLLVTLYPFIFLLAGNSRWAAFYFVIPTLVFLVEKKKGYAFISFSFMLIILQKVLIGRSLFYHGLSHTFDYLTADRTESITLQILSIVINIFEGAMNIGNTLLHSPNFNDTYKNLSFSPLFSFMDGFSGIRDDMKFKWAPHVPMSALSESFQFGYVYFLSFLGVYFILLKNIDALLRKKLKPTIIFVFFIFIYIALGMHTYSVRTFWKLMLLLALVTIYLQVGRKAK
jgi:hypothetical protein